MKRVKNIKNGKAADTLYLCSEMLKWTGPVAKEYMHALLNHAIKQVLLKIGKIPGPTHYTKENSAHQLSHDYGPVLDV